MLQGLLDAILNLLPNDEHKSYVRHLYTNFKKNTFLKGKVLKDCLWKATKATYLKEFEDAMIETKALSPEAHKWLEEKKSKLVIQVTLFNYGEV